MLGTVFGIFVFFILFFFLIIGIGTIAGLSAADQSAGKQVLFMDLRQPVLDHTGAKPIFGAESASVVNIARSLNRAKKDDSIKGLFIRANEFGMVPASAEEIRLAILDFKESGKFVITHSQGFEGTTLTPYMAISASDEIWQQDTTGFAIAGLRSETGFYGGVFEKYDAKPQFEQFHEYKNAANVYTQTDYTDAHRESTNSLLTSLYDSMMAQISTDRKQSTEAVKAVFDTSPHSAEDAKKAGLIDVLGHYNAAREHAREKAGGKSVKFLPITNYAPKGYVTGPVIAFIGGQGPVVTGESADSSNPFATSLSMGGDSVAHAFDMAIKDKKVEAIVFRVSTPGGSPAASDQIHDAVARAKEAGKPVIISMGQYAASGGYYVAANADKIVAMPTTITGSIGVLGGKIALRDTFAKVGYNIESISKGGDYLGAFSADEPFTQAQRAAYRGQLEDIYEDFTQRVADGRDMPIEQVKEIAKGRVWTGAEAKDIGLVDEFGGILKAIAVAKELVEIEADKEVYLKRFPRPKTTQQQIEELFGSSVKTSEDLARLSQIMNRSDVKALLEASTALQGGQELKADLPDIR